MVGIVCERLAQGRHRNVDAAIEFHDGIVRPKNLPDFLAGNDLALPLDQDAQNLEGLLAEQNLWGPSLSSPASDREQFPGSDVELEVTKADHAGLIGRSIHCLAAKLPCAITPFPTSNLFSCHEVAEITGK
jgi:hypothetical protein